MSNLATYHFNPFSLVTQVDDEIMVNTYPPNRVRFPASFKPVINFFIQNGELHESDVLKCIAPSRLEELLAKKVLLKGPPRPLEGRYSRQMGYLTMISDQPDVLQDRVKASHVLILGAGAIGSHTCWNLAAIGVGKLTVVDFDTIEESNFNRQLMYTPADLGKCKVEVLSEKIRAFNPGIEVVSVNKKITSAADVEALIAGVNLVVKAIDTPEESMEWVNDTCVRHGVPYICGGFLDSTAVVGPNYLPKKSACFACQQASGAAVRRLHGTGPTFGPLTTLVTSMLSMLAFKILIGKAEGFANRVYIYNADNGTWDNELVAPARDCPVCDAKKHTPPDSHSEQRRQVVAFRSLFAAMLLLTVIFGGVYEQPLVGVMAFFGLFACIPVVSKIHRDDPLKTRREFFVLSCIYSGFRLLGLFIDSLYHGNIKWTRSLRDIFTALQAVDASILQAALGITLLFLLLCAVKEVAPKVMAFLDQELASE